MTALQSIGERNKQQLGTLPNSPQAGSDMLNNMVVRSNQIGEAMKKDNLKKKKGASEKNAERTLMLI